MRARTLSVAIYCSAVLGACTPTNTTLRFTSDRSAVMVRNPESPKGGDRLEALIGTRKKIFFYVPHGASVTSFNASIDTVAGERKLLAALTIDQHSLRVFAIQLQPPLTIFGPPTPQNKVLMCDQPAIANILDGAATEIVGTGRGSWIAISSSSRHLYLRAIDPDLIVLVDADSLDSARAADFILRMGSLTVEHAP